MISASTSQSGSPSSAKRTRLQRERDTDSADPPSPAPKVDPKVYEPSTAPELSSEFSTSAPVPADDASLERQARQAPSGDRRRPPLVVDGNVSGSGAFSAPDRWAQREKRERDDEAFIQRKKNEFAQYSFSEQRADLNALHQGLNNADPKYLRIAQSTQEQLSGEHIGWTWRPDNILKAAKVSYDALTLRDIMTNGGGLTNVRPQAWDDAISRQKKTYSKPGEQLLLNTYRWAENAERRYAIEEFKKKTSPAAFEAMRTGYQAFTGLTVPDHEKENTFHSNRVNHELYRAAHDLQSSTVPDLAFVNQEGTQRAVDFYNMRNQKPSDEDFAQRAADKSLDVMNERLGGLKAKSNGYFQGIAKLAVEASRGKPLAPWQLSSTADHLEAARVAKDAFDDAAFNPSLAQVTPTEIALARASVEEKPETPEVVLRRAAAISPDDARNFDFAQQVVEKLDPGEKPFSPNLHEFHAKGDTETEGRKNKLLRYMNELKHANIPGPEKLNAKNFGDAVALDKEFGEGAPPNVGELARTGAFLQKYEANQFQATRENLKLLRDYTQTPEEERYKELGVFADYLKDTTGSAMRDAARAAGGSADQQAKAQHLGATAGVIVSLKAPTPIGLGIAAKVAAGEVLAGLRSAWIRRDRDTLSKAFLHELDGVATRIRDITEVRNTQNRFWFQQSFRI